MWSVIVLTTLLLPQGGGRGSVSVGAVRPVLELALAAPVEWPDGRRVGATAVVAPGADPWFIYSSGTLCDSAITRGAMPASATEAWRVVVSERARTDTHLTVAVAWARAWEFGRAVAAGSSGTSEITLRAGDRIPLDRITRSAQGDACGATQKSLELRLATRIERLVNPVSAERQPPPAPDANLPNPIVVELWMVHVVPGRRELVERQTVRLAPGGTGFLFRGLPVDSAAGSIVIELSGQLRAVTRPDGTTGLSTGLTRTVMNYATGRLHSSTGVGEKTVDWPAPGDVVSFAVPDPSAYADGGGSGVMGGRGGVAAGGAMAGGGRGVGSGVAAVRGANLLDGHQLSLRVRLSEIK